MVNKKQKKIEFTEYKELDLALSNLTTIPDLSRCDELNSNEVSARAFKLKEQIKAS